MLIARASINRTICLFCLLQCWFGIARSQVNDPVKPVDSCYQQDLPELLRKWRKKPPADKSAKQSSLLLVPVIGSNPATGFMFGVAGQLAFKEKSAISRYSLIVANLTVTTKRQLMFQVKNNVFLNDNRYFLSGDWRFFLFSQSTYGLGTNAPEGGVLDYQYGINGIDVNDDSLVQPMKFNHIRFHQTVNRAVGSSFFIGLGYHLDYYYNIIDERLDTAEGRYTSHYVYSKQFGFDPENYVRSGFSFNLMYDTRDNQVNAYKGMMFNLNWRFDPEFIGSTRSANLLSLEWRSFHGLSKRNPRHLMSFWLLGNFSPDGDLPYLGLPALGYDQRGRAGRGFTQGRYRGPDMVYGEAEYRFPISPCTGLLGGVLFVNATTAGNAGKTVGLFDYVQPGYGVGLRLMVDKNSRTNLQVDFGFSKKATGIYFGAAETF